MKIRNGFVSNSSSSSFILNGKHTTTAQVAVLMMYQMKHEWSKYWDHDERPGDDKFYEALQWLEDNDDFDDPLLLPWSCNYESFIWRAGDNEIYIDTCNNHDWTLLGGRYHGDGFYNEGNDVHFLNMENNIRQTAEEYRKAWWANLKAKKKELR